jgi:hypothetical protein
VAHYLLHEEASDSRRRCDPYAPSKWSNKRDHAADDAQIQADYFTPMNTGATPVSCAT